MRVETLAEGVTLYCGDCLDVLKTLEANSVDACVTDPPYGLGFMGKAWDHGVPGVPYWKQVYRILKPGGHLLSFGGTRTYHRMACAIEDAGFEVRDMVSWMYGSGFPKSLDVSKAIDREAGAEREVIGRSARCIGPSQIKSRETAFSNGASLSTQGLLTAPATDLAREWSGYGTALKPACEPIVLARKPLSESTVAANVLKWGTGALNIDACRIEASGRPAREVHAPRDHVEYGGNALAGRVDGSLQSSKAVGTTDLGRWPANVIHDGSDEVVGAFPDRVVNAPGLGTTGTRASDGWGMGATSLAGIQGSDGSAARFFASFPKSDSDRAWKNDRANYAESSFCLSSEAAVSALSHAVAASTGRLVLQKQNVRVRDTNVSGNELGLIAASVTEAIQNIERRFSLALPPESITVKLGHVTCVATPRPTGTTTITVSLLKSGRSVEAVIFSTIEMNAEAGASGSARRFWYTAKADGDDRLGSKHPTVKPVDLIQYLVRLVTPPRGLCLDPFAGTGTLGEACIREGMRAILIEREAEYQDDIRRRMKLALAGPLERKHVAAAARYGEKPFEAGTLFATVER